MAVPVLTPDGRPTDDEWLTTSEAVDYSRLPMTMLRSWARSGRGPEHRRIGGAGGTLLWRKSALTAILAAS